MCIVQYFCMENGTHNSDDLLSQLTTIQSGGQNIIPLELLIGIPDHNKIAIEPIMSSLKSIPGYNISFKFDGDKTLSMQTTDNSIQVFFEITF